VLASSMKAACLIIKASLVTIYNDVFDEHLFVFAAGLEKAFPSPLWIFVATTTANIVAVVRTFPAIVMSTSSTWRMLLRQSCKTCARVVKLINFVQNRFKSHDCAPFLSGALARIPLLGDPIAI
jgi:hypothetical protein